VLTPEERRFLVDHLRAGTRTGMRIAAVELTLLGLGTAAGIALGVTLAAAENTLRRIRHLYPFGS
jgi:hypothetical protein